MSVGRYFFNLLKLENRALETQCGGHPEVPCSARVGYWCMKGYRRGRFFAAIINGLFRDPTHVERAYLSEDDDLVRYASDPEGRWIFLMLMGAVVYRVAIIGCIAVTVYYARITF